MLVKLENVICKILFSKGFNALIFSWQDGELNSKLKAKGVLFTYTLKRLERMHLSFSKIFLLSSDSLFIEKHSSYTYLVCY